jgi:general secretion pathway protein K
VRFRRNERGLALVSVLWGISLLSLIAGALMSSGVLSRHMERNAWNRVRAEALIQAAINRAVLGLMDARTDQRWRIDGTEQTFTFQGADVIVRIEDEFGKIDLNASDSDAFRRLFRSTGVEPSLADALAERMLEWRTAGDGHGVNSGGDADYRSARLSYLPRHGAFQSVDELKLVLGMTPELFARVEPAITVYSQRPFFDLNVAPSGALLTLPGLDPDRVATMMDERRTGAGIRLSPPQGVVDPWTSTAGRAFTIVVMLLNANTHLTERETIRLTGDRNRPYLVLNKSGVVASRR